MVEWRARADQGACAPSLPRHRAGRRGRTTMQQQPDPPLLARRLFAVAGALVLSSLYLAWAIDPDGAYRWITLLSALPVFVLCFLFFGVLFERTYVEAARQQRLADAGSRSGILAVLLTPAVVLIGVLAGLCDWGTGSRNRRP